MMERVKRVVSLVLCLVMVFGLLPMSAFAVSTDDTLTAALNEAKSYINSLTVNNSSNDPATVVKNYGTEFTWDNEKRETNNKSYLYDWSYYNGVVFEGIEYLYEVTDDTTYKDYVVEYMSSLIASNGTWATCSNNSSKQRAGYNASHGADCYKTASLLLDAYEMTNDQRYLTMAATLYADLDTAAANSTYNLSNCGNNYRHTWASDPSPDLWLDGLYMILPFRAEYAKHIGDQEELDLIVKRLQWVSDNMYNSSNGLFYHAADSATSNSGNYWLRAMGWYAAAMVDVMDSMEGDNLETMKKQLVKFVDGMKKNQNTSNGMWKNNVLSSETAKNPYETSGTALTCYAVMKAVNNGWLDESYADMAILAFKGICNEKLDGNTLKDICFKGSPGSGNETFYDNEGKGVGPFIMFYAEVLEYVNSQEEEPEVTEPEVTEPEVTEPEVTEPVITHISVEGTTAYAVGDDLTFTTLKAFYSGGSIDLMDENGYPVDDVVITGDYDMNTVGEYSVVVSYAGFDRTYHFTVSLPQSLYNDSVSGISISGSGDGISNVSASVNTEAEGVVAKTISADGSVTFSLSGTFVSSGYKAKVTLPVDESWENVAVYHVDGDKYTKYDDVDSDPATYTFVTGHFSDWEQTYDLKAAAETGSNYGEGNLVADTTYTYEWDTNGVNAGTAYLFVNGTTTTVLENNGTSGITTATISTNGGAAATSATRDYDWYIDSSNRIYTTVNGTTYYLRRGSGTNLSLTNSSNNATTWTISNNSGTYTISNKGSKTTYYLTTSGLNNSGGTVRLYAYKSTSSSSGEAVTFTLNPVSGTILPEDEVMLTGVVTVAGKEVDLSECTITWASSDTAKATVSNGTVTGVADGTADITAKLTAVNGTALAGDGITVTITVTVKNKTVVSKEIFGNSDRVVRLNGVVDYSDIYLVLTYDDGSEVTIPYNQLTFGSVDTSKVGENEVGIFYNGEPVDTVNVTVSASPYAGLETTTDYPVYPAPGSVRLNKTAKELDFESTGTVQVELSTAGIPMRTGVDVVLTVDISNSMAWKNGSTADNMSDNKLLDVMAAIKSFAAIFLADNEVGSDTNNTITIVTFGGYDAENFNPTTNNIDATRTLISATDDIELIKEICDNTKFLNGATASGQYAAYDLQLAYYDVAEKKVKTENAGGRGDTNYDFAFWQTGQAIKEGNLGDGNRALYVLFMTDGCASNYNNTYYRKSTTALNPGTQVFCSGAVDHRDLNDGGKVWTNVILESIKANGGNIYAKSYQNEIDGMYAIGFDMAYGSFSGINDWDAEGFVKETVFNEIVSKTYVDSDGNGLVHVTDADSTEELNEFYATLAGQLKIAGTEARVTDVVDSEFTLQLNVFGGGETLIDETNPTIQVRRYETWTAAEVNANDYDTHLVGTRKRYNGATLLTDPTAAGYELGEYKYTVLEEVTFTYDSDGNVNAAYSSVIGSTPSIYSVSDDGVTTINAKYFTYTNDGTAETFKWNIGDITEGEVALTYYAYLKGSTDGSGAEKGYYYTNEYAYLEYIDINGKYAKRDFPLPQVYWGSATTAYEFYLVNEAGVPCDRNGNVLAFEDRIIIVPPTYVVMLLNTNGTYYSEEIVAAEVLPAGYTLYDETSYYYVKCASGSLSGELVISEPGYGLITEENYTGTRYAKVENEDGTVTFVESATGTYKKITTQTTRVVYANVPSYVQTRLAFGVVYNLIPKEIDLELTPDRVVIDYGKPILIDITNGNQDLTDGDGKTYDADLVGFGVYNADVNLNEIYNNTTATDNFSGAYGTFSISDAENCIVKYTPNKLVEGIDNIFCHLKVTELDEDGEETSNVFYMVDWLTVIPATVMYYETDFADGVFTTATTDGAWSTVNKGNAADGPQDAGVVGSDNHVYGYDSTYNDDAYLSNGSSKFVSGAGVDATTVTFSFTGTGFDLISRTGTEQGLIKVQVFSDPAMTKLVKTVSVLNKSETELELYQIPVVSMNGLSEERTTFYVKIGVYAGYDHATIDELDRGAEFYFDAIRVYDPAQGNEIAETAYNDDGEANEQIIEVRELLITADDFNALTPDDKYDGAVFVDCTYVKNDEGNYVSGNVGVADYAAIGPNNELYLTNGQAVAFKFKANKTPATFDIGAKTIKGDAPATLNVTICNANGGEYWTVSKEIGSSTVQFIDLFDNVVSGSINKSALFKNDTYIVITNNGSGILSITDIKAAYSVDTAEVLGTNSNNSNNTTVNGSTYDPFAVSYSVDAQTLSVARSVLLSQNGTTVEPEQPEVDATALKIVKASAKKNGNSGYTVSVVTSQEVKDVLVMQGSVELEPAEISYVDNADGTRTWTIVVSNGVSSRYGFFTLIGVGEGSVQGAAFNVAKSR